MARLLELVRRIAEIPAPTFREAARAAFVAERFHALGLPTEVDAAGNVVAWMGPEGAPALCFAAHLDTVFPDGEVRTRVEGDLLFGLGVADDAAGLAVLLRLAEAFAGVSCRRRLYFLADVGEEGLGDLRGVRAFVDAHPDLLAFVSLDGSLGSVVTEAVGVRRLRLTVRGPGGHSWGDYGRPSAIHRLVAALEAVLRVGLPSSPRTTLNVGLLQGGTSVNSIAAEASAFLDLRSVSAEALAALEDAVRRAAAGQLADVAFAFEVVGERPVGRLMPSHPLVTAARRALAREGVRAVRQSGSTDANYPLSRGMPAIAFGVVEAVGAHTPEERLVIPSLAAGYRAAHHLLAELAAGGLEGSARS